jgi:hypothetical protein
VVIFPKPHFLSTCRPFGTPTTLRRLIHMLRTAGTVLLICVGLLVATVGTAAAGDTARPDFSGKYIPANGKGEIIQHADWALEVVQTRSEIQVTETFRGKVIANRYKLDGSLSPYTRPEGGKGTCAARFKGGTLMLDKHATIPQADGRGERQIHVSEQWVLSPDSRTIRVDIASIGVVGAVIWAKVPRRRR